jgi:hypothetical protein
MLQKNTHTFCCNHCALYCPLFGRQQINKLKIKKYNISDQKIYKIKYLVKNMPDYVNTLYTSKYTY